MADAPSAIGNLTELKEGEVLLPGFVRRGGDGLYVELNAIDSNELFRGFVERVFSAGARFAGLDYDCFRNLLFEYEPQDIGRLAEQLEKQGKRPELRLADGIVPFPPQRRQFYRSVKILGRDEGAEYFFEPVLVDEEAEIPPDAAPDAPLPPPKQARVKLDFDEFVADLWGKGVRFGLDQAAVRAAIDGDETGRVVIARMKPPTPGKDASVAEQNEVLYRDDSPFIRPDGRMDLRHFRNRFPQVRLGALLFKKLPRILGKQGWSVAGKALKPDEPKDFDLSTMAGPGSRVENLPGGEYIVAGMDGFLNIDTRTNQISVTEKIINREGVSLRTTGDLTLSGDEFEEHGEVQEQRNVEGKNMTFLADVFGNVLSSGGRLLLKKNLAGGSAIAREGGSVTVEGSASRATVEARDGEITLAYAESCFIIGRKVVIGRAVSCDIYADELTVDLAEGCALAAARLSVGTSKARKDVETVASVLVPDLSPYANRLEGLKKSRSEAERLLAEKNRELEALSAIPELKGYLILSRQIKAGEVRLTKEQEAGFLRLRDRLAPTLVKMEALQGAVKAARISLDGLNVQIQGVVNSVRAAFANVACTVRSVEGETVVRALLGHEVVLPVRGMSSRDLRAALRKIHAGSEGLFSGATGSLDWKCPPPALSADETKPD